MYQIVFLLVFLSIQFSSWALIDQNIYQNKYGSYFVPLHHSRPAVNAIKEGQVYEKDTLEFIEAIYEKGTDVIHAGTYFGDMLPFFSSLVKENNVWAFEPVALNYDCATKNIQLNDLKNVNLFHLALSDKTTQLIMNTMENGEFLGGGSKIVKKDSTGQEDGLEFIEAVRGDSILAGNSQRIGLIHIA